MEPDNNLAVRDAVFSAAELRKIIFSYLDPQSVKAVALVSR